MLVNGLNINARVNLIKGQGQCLLFLHGWGGSLASFEGAESFFAKKHTTINLDWPGHGKSDDPPAYYDVGQYAVLVKDLVRQLGVSKVNIVAHSFGGRIAIKLASLFPDLVGKLVLTGCAGVKPRFSLKRNLRITNFKLKRMLNKSGLLKKFDENAYGSVDYKALDPNMKQVFRRVVNDDLTPLLNGLRAPTLLVWGKKDVDTPIYMAKRMNKGIIGSRLVVFEDSGHYAYVERFDSFISLVNDFLRD